MRQGNRCICGRNLDYPLKVTEKFVICRCGRRHKQQPNTVRVGMKPIIYKLDRYSHRGDSPLCSACLEKRSIGITRNGNLACVMCQNKVDVYIAGNFDVRPESELKTV